jgi:hypothetical protein
VVLVALAFSVLPAAAGENGKTAGLAQAPSVQEQLQQQQQRIADLERLLEQQTQVLQQMQQQLAALAEPAALAGNSASAAAPALPGQDAQQELERISGEVDALAETTHALNEKVNQVDKKASDTEKSLSAKVKGLGNFSFGGDIRLRLELFRGGTNPERTRGRFRARFDVKNKFTDEWRAGLRLATGDLDEPISTNQSFTSFFGRKSFAIDQAYVVYTPNWFKPLTLTGGKFAYTWKRTELTFDSDLNPEGISPVLSFDLKETPLQNIKVIALALPFRESSGGKDSYTMGGGLQTTWDLGPWMKLEAGATYTDWFNTDAILQAALAQALLGNSITNAASDTAFASRFGLLDLIAELKFDTGYERWPLLLLFDYVTNTRACANVDIAGVDCNPNDRQGYWAEIAFGQTKERHDIQVGYTLIHIEQEAVLGPFNFSDLRQATDVVNHRLSFAYQAYKNIQLGYTLLIGRELGSDEPWLKRSQIDMIYKF